MKRIFGKIKTYGLILFVLFMSCKKENTNLAPEINNQAFSIDENSPEGTLVGQVIAIDADSDTLSFDIIGGNTNEAFTISAKDGKITIQNENAIDFETNPTFTLNVEVKDDRGEFATAIIEIQLNNIEIPTTGLILCLPFNGNAEDVSSNNFNGIVHGALLVSDRNGVDNNAYFFDGIDDYIEIGDMEELSFPNNKNFTISFWAELKSYDRNQFIISKYFSTGDNREYSLVYKSSIDSYKFAIYDGGLSYDTLVSIKMQGWHHLVGMKDNNKIYLFVDNELVSEKLYSTNQLSSFAKLIIGACDRSNTSPDEFFHGTIDDITMYNRALSIEEIKTLFKE